MGKYESSFMVHYVHFFVCYGYVRLSGGWVKIYAAARKGEAPKIPRSGRKLIIFQVKPTVSFLWGVYGGFPKIGVPQNGWFIVENSLKLMIWGYHYFWKHPYLNWCAAISSDIFGGLATMVRALFNDTILSPARK